MSSSALHLHGLLSLWDEDHEEETKATSASANAPKRCASPTVVPACKRMKTQRENDIDIEDHRPVWARVLHKHFVEQFSAKGGQLRALKLQSLCSGMCTEHYALEDMR
eukprot:223352-Amphidinium_carterae.2